jgi:hypothetical protein
MAVVVMAVVVMVVYERCVVTMVFYSLVRGGWDGGWWL